MKEYLETGKVAVLEKEKENPILFFTDIYGVGPKKAKELVEKGIRTMDELRGKQNEVLNDVQRVGLKYYENILERIPRAEIDQYDSLLKAEFEKIAIPGAEYEIVGSYRRGAISSGDIDIIITSPNADLFGVFIDRLVSRGIILEVLSRGKSKCLVIARLPGSEMARRVDFLYTNQEEYPFAILYFTGSKAFNTVMRAVALKQGVSLNEHGLYKKESGKAKEEKVDSQFNSERDIFDYLYLEYMEPRLRIDGRSVLPKNSPKIKSPEKIEEKMEEVLNESLLKEENKKQENIVIEKSKENPKVKRPYKKRTLKVIPQKSPILASQITKPISPPKIEEKEEVLNESLLKEEKEKESVRKEKRPYKKRTLKVIKPISPTPTLLENIKSTVEKIISPPKKESTPLPPAKIESVRKEKRKYKKRTLKIGKPISPEKIEKELSVLRISSSSEKEEEKENSKKDINTKAELSSSISCVESMQHIQQFKEKGISVLENLSEKQLADMLTQANDVYYNTKQSLMTDNEFDILKEYVEKTYPKNPVLEKIGAPVATKNKVRLPYSMPSMDKIKPDTNALANWMQKYKGPYVLSCKLDGVSGMYTTEKGASKLYTRGDGTIGQDISHLLPRLNLPQVENLVVRGEFILQKRVFDEKYKTTFANPRNLVSGIINAKTIDEKSKDLHFVAYEIISPAMKPSEQMVALQRYGFEVVQNQTENTLTNELLSTILMDWRANYQYEMDGIIVADDNIYKRVLGNPDHAFAFKMVLSDQVAEAKVVDVIWTASKSGYLKPRVRIEPIHVGGVTIEYATGFNGNFIETNKIGIGAVIQLTRSGDVIPHIIAVITPAEKAKMPDVPYHWTDTHVDIVLDNAAEDETVVLKNITDFFRGIEVDGLSSGNVRRIITAGYDSVAKILKMEKTDFERVEGFKGKMVEKIYNGIRAQIAKASLLDIMVASNLFGRGIGERKIRPILEAHSDILTNSTKQTTEVLTNIPGIGKENAKSFLENIPRFMEFLKECGLDSKLTGSLIREEPATQTILVEDVSNPLYQKRIVMTKTRDPTVMDGLKRLGAVLEDKVGKNTFAVITKSVDDESNKTKEAKKLGIPVMVPEEFIAKYLK